MRNQEDAKNSGSTKTNKDEKSLSRSDSLLNLTRRDFIKTAAVTGAVTAVAPHIWIKPAWASDPLKIGVMIDMSKAYAFLNKQDLIAVNLAVEDAGGKALGKPIEVIARDHRLDPGIANEKAKELYEKEKVDVIIDVPQSACSLAVNEQSRIHKRLFISVDSGTSDQAGDKCNYYAFDWAYDNYMLATAAGLWAAEHLGKKWYAITADYEWGHDLLKNFKAAVEKKGGEIIGNDMVALGTSDFSPYMIKALNSGAEVLVLLNAGADTVNSTKAAKEFGLKKKMKILHALMFISNVKATGIDVYEDDYVTAAWYWKSKNPGVEEYVRKFKAKQGTPPHWLTAGNYSATLQYIKAVQRANSKDPDKVIEQLEGLEFKDMFADPGYIYKENHQQIQDALIVRCKRANEVKEDWDFFEIVGKVPAKEAYRTPEQCNCKMKRPA
jgi:branched-chain amino acid transport system substrate-binding protein